jgi:hypothetical protein
VFPNKANETSSVIVSSAEGKADFFYFTSVFFFHILFLHCLFLFQGEPPTPGENVTPTVIFRHNSKSTEGEVLQATSAGLVVSPYSTNSG